MSQLDSRSNDGGPGPAREDHQRCRKTTSETVVRIVARADQLVAGLQKQNSFKSTSITAGCP
jgi:hypothetical protein